jgi:sec-independent protein translocase protein TatA
MFHPMLAIIDAPIIIGIVALAALLFGADKLPKLARSAGAAKKEFMMGQIEADEAAAKARDEMRARTTPSTTEPTPPEAESHQ